MKSFLYKHFRGSIQFSKEDDCYFGKILDIQDLVNYEASSISELEIEFQKTVDDYLKKKKNDS